MVVLCMMEEIDEIEEDEFCLKLAETTHAPAGVERNTRNVVLPRAEISLGH